MPRAASTRATAAAATSKGAPSKQRAEQTREQQEVQAGADIASKTSAVVGSKRLRSKDKNVPASTLTTAGINDVMDAKPADKGKTRAPKAAATLVQPPPINAFTASRATRAKSIASTVPSRAAGASSSQEVPLAEPSARMTRQRSKAPAQLDTRQVSASRKKSTTSSRVVALRTGKTTANRKQASSSSSGPASARAPSESEEIPSTPPHLRWMREELEAQGSADEEQIGSTPPLVKWTAEEREEIEREAGELLRAAEERVRLASQEDSDAAEQGAEGQEEDAEMSERASDKENLDPSSELQRSQRLRQQQEQQQQELTHRNRAKHASSASEPDLSLESSNALGLADKEPQHSTPFAEKSTERKGRREVDLARVQSARKPLREIVLAREEGAKRQDKGKWKQEKQTLDEMMDLRDASRSNSRKQQRQQQDDKDTLSNQQEAQKDPYRAAQDPYRLQRWIAAHAGAQHAAADEPSPRPPPHDQGMTQSEDALEREAQDQSCTTLRSYQPSWLLRDRAEAAYDSVDEDFERRKRRKVAEKYEAQEDDDPFGILLEVRQTARVERRKGLLYRPSSPIQRHDQAVPATPSRRQNAQEEQPLVKDASVLASSSPLSSIRSCKDSLLLRPSPKDTIKDSSSSDKENSKPLSSLHMEDLLELLPKRAPRRTRSASTAIASKGKKSKRADQGKRVVSGKGKVAKKAGRQKAKGGKKTLSDSESGEEDVPSAEESEEENAASQVKKKQGTLRKLRVHKSKQMAEESSPTLSPNAEAGRKRRLEYYRNLQTYNMKEELVL